LVLLFVLLLVLSVTALALRRGLEKGFSAVLFLELGSLIGDATWAIIALVGAAILVQNTLALVNLTCGLALGLLAIKLMWNTIIVLKGQ
jgi:chemosensory pili system protein ChpE